tara:strand:- start:1659 stop:2078 length:420 start_codon:yes stop_codon:yes gene_type:complete
MREDPWRDHRFRDPFDLGEKRAFIEQGTDTSVAFHPPSDAIDNGTVCIVFEAVGNLDKFEFTIGENTPTNIIQHNVDAGWHSTCAALTEPTTDELELNIDWSGSDSLSGRWINPIGFSGRGDALFDRTGIRLQWVEYRA